MRQVGAGSSTPHPEAYQPKHPQSTRALSAHHGSACPLIETSCTRPVPRLQCAVCVPHALVQSCRILHAHHVVVDAGAQRAEEVDRLAGEGVDQRLDVVAVNVVLLRRTDTKAGGRER